jgi:hypothetical protein
MATRIAWWLNLDAGLELERPATYVRSAAMEQRMRALAPRLSLLLAPDDVVLDGGLRAEDLPELTPLAFCPTPSADAALQALGFRPAPGPPLELLRNLTRRAFAASLGQTLPGSRYVTSLAELLELLADSPPFSGEWLLKRDFSFAARERRRVRGGVLDPSTLGFAKASFGQGQGLQVEPWVQREADFASHAYLLADATLLRGPLLRQHCDARGVWQASEVVPESTLAPEEAAALKRAVSEAGRALSAAGYAGPFGVDAFRYRGPTGTLDFQPRSEINVRFSMGYPRSLLEHALSALRAREGGCASTANRHDDGGCD